MKSKRSIALIVALLIASVATQARAHGARTTLVKKLGRMLCGRALAAAWPGQEAMGRAKTLLKGFVTELQAVRQ